MRPTLQVRLSQNLALTPQLQQSIRLLQLSTLELQQEVEQMLASNPLLEPDSEGDERAEGSTPLAAPASERVHEPSAEGGDAAHEGEANGELKAEDFGGTERDDWENGTEHDDFDGIRELPSLRGEGLGGEGEDGAQERDAGVVTLQDHLREQMAGMQLGAMDRAALLALIESLNEDGFLEDSLEELAESFASPDSSEEEREAVHDALRLALALLHSMDPTGVGARDLAQCLQLQLQRQSPSPQQQLALRVCQQDLGLLGRRDWRRLALLTGADEEALREAAALIATLEPHPARRFGRTEASAVVPDVIVRKTGRGLDVQLNPDVMPRLRINQLYAEALRAARGLSQTPLGGQLQEARWFIKNVQQRFDTILRVSQAIVRRQRGFFTHGELAMKPLVLREIADELELHESTISRVTTAKYMATPWGTFELKYFFGSGLSTETGGSASSTAVRALIKQFVAAEDAAKPLSDNQLAQMLEEQGIQVARRTVAKYREALRIAPAAQRKAR
ncbi:RNA polymerase factor sigma-54 [Roseateles sp. BYS180W]|uniref:RNA polymerase sigma-54 factor n=1 Tax=Roseateles rivi TaxID=3299028 RepID=A0ABW7FTQ7_9BURK